MSPKLRRLGAYFQCRAAADRALTEYTRRPHCPPLRPHSAALAVLWAASELSRRCFLCRSYELTRKDRLCKNIERMKYIRGAKHFDFIPPSYIMPTEYQVRLFIRICRTFILC